MCWSSSIIINHQNKNKLLDIHKWDTNAKNKGVYLETCELYILIILEGNVQTLK